MPKTTHKNTNLGTTQQKRVKQRKIENGLKLAVFDRKIIQYKAYKLSKHFCFWKFVHEKQVFAGVFDIANSLSSFSL